MYDYGIWPRRDPELRASDAEREAFGERLRRSHADGRLTTEEFQERIDRCYSAKTIGELDQLVTDLPAERQPRSVRPVIGRRLWVVPVVCVVIAILAVSAVTGGWHHHDGGSSLWGLLPLLLVLRLFFWGRVRRTWRGPGTQLGR